MRKRFVDRNTSPPLGSDLDQRLLGTRVLGAARPILRLSRVVYGKWALIMANNRCKDTDIFEQALGRLNWYWMQNTLQTIAPFSRNLKNESSS